MAGYGSGPDPSPSPSQAMASMFDHRKHGIIVRRGLRRIVGTAHEPLLLLVPERQHQGVLEVRSDDQPRRLQQGGGPTPVVVRAAGAFTNPPGMAS